MKRLFGLIGFTYLSVLTAVFYLFSDAVIVAMLSISALLIVGGVVLILAKKLKSLNKSITVIGATALVACLVLVLYQNIYYAPLIAKYSDKELNVTGYVCDEVDKNDSRAMYIIKTDTINGNAESIKIRLTTFNGCTVEAFDKIEAKLTLTKNEYNSVKSRGIFFLSTLDEDSSFTATGEKQSSLYSFAVSIRQAMKSSLDAMLTSNESALCKAVLLGDKNALPYSIRSSFVDTGSSYLIVVSGMHLAIVVGFVIFLVKKITKRTWITFAFATATVISFMAITGFYPSVVRAGIMTIIAYMASVFFRHSDSANSLGVAALVIALPNPFVVGDVGLLLSFTATLGIILWGDKIYYFIFNHLPFKKWLMKHNLLSKLVKFLVGILSTSIAASIWIVPISTIAFGRVSPYVVFISLLVSPFVSILIVCALIVAVFYYIPLLSYIAYPLSFVCGVLCKYIIGVISWFSSLPHPYIESDNVYFYYSLGIALLIIAVGYLINAKRFYVRFFSAFCSALFLICCVISILCADSQCTVSVFNVGGGVSAIVHNGNYLSMISCGGNYISNSDILDRIADETNSVDYIIIPDKKLKYSRYESDISNTFDVTNVLVYDSKRKTTDVDFISDNVSYGRSNTQLELMFSETVTNTILNVDGVTYQLVKGRNSSFLFVPTGADISKLPENFRTADYLLIDNIPKNYDLLNCKTVVFSGNHKDYYEKYNSLSEICNNVLCTADDIVEIKI